jgi:cytochrome d ubiquinol oxidase subunit I
LTTLILFGAVYAFIFSFGTYYIHRLLRTGPVGSLATVPSRAVPNRPMSLVDPDPVPRRAYLEAGE